MTGGAFVWDDIWRTLAALPALGTVLLVPGFFVGHMLDVGGFRRLRPGSRFAQCVLLSLATVPIASYVAWRAAGFGAVMTMLVVVWAAALGILLRDLIRSRSVAISEGLRLPRGVLIAAVLWVLAALWYMADFGWGPRLFPAMLMDNLKHIAVTDAISRTGIPPANPFVFPGEPFQLSYYYFWHLVIAIPTRLFGDLITPRAATFAGTIWCGVILASAAIVWVRDAGGGGAGAKRVAGIAPVSYTHLRAHET